MARMHLLILLSFLALGNTILWSCQPQLEVIEESVRPDGMLVVTLVGMGVTASAVAAGVTAPVWVPIAGAVIMVYGILDYAFDVNGKIDQAIGREDKKKK